MPTLQDVAQHAGVSTATVSKVISGTPYVSAPTAARVRASIEALGYRPNLAARALSSGKTYIIAVVLPYVYDALFHDPLVMQILEGIETICTEQHYNLLLSTPRPDEQGLEQYRQTLESGYVEGLIAIDNVEGTSFAAEAARFKIPTVTIGYDAPAHSIRSDDFEGGRLAMAHLLANGHQQIGLISVPVTTNVAVQRRLAGMRDYAQAAGIDFDSLPAVESDFSTNGGAAAAEALLKAAPNITALMSVNDRMAIGALRYLAANGKRVPDDISVIGYDDIGLAEVVHPPLSTISQDAVELGCRAAGVLFDVLDKRETESVVLPPRLVTRNSVAKLAT